LEKTALNISLTAIFGALYAVGVIVLAPISFFLVQVRIADAIIPLSIMFGWPVILGVTIGNIVANMYGGLGIIDIAGGTIANFLASFFAYKLRKKPFLATWAATATITIIVGSYLSFLFSVPVEIGLLGVFIGSVIAINILGYLLLLAMKKASIPEQFGFEEEQHDDLE